MYNKHMNRPFKQSATSEAGDISAPPDILDTIPAYPATPEQDARAMADHRRETRHERRHTRIKRAIASVALGAALGTGVLITEVQRDVHAGQERVAEAHSMMHTIYRTDHEDARDVATIVATGLGTRDASSTAKLLTPYRQIGNVYALEYSNRDINVDELTGTVLRQLRADKITYVNADGFSAGGPILLAVMAEITEKAPDIRIISVVMNSSPVGEDSLTQRSLDAADILQKILQYDPNLMYSEKARVVAEVIARNERYHKDGFPYVYTDKLLREARDVYETKYVNPMAASGSLIASQYRFLTAYNVAPAMKKLSETSHPPQVVYTRAAHVEDDTVVRIDTSETNALALMKKYGIDGLSIHIDHIGHANPGERPTEYNRTTQEMILPKLEASLHDAKIDDLLRRLGQQGVVGLIPMRPR